MWFEVKDLQAHKKAPQIFPVLKELEASLIMGIYEDRQIHTKTGFRPIKLQERRSGPHTNRTPSNKGEILNGPLKEYTNKRRTDTDKTRTKLTETTLIAPTRIHTDKTKNQNEV